MGEGSSSSFASSSKQKHPIVKVHFEPNMPSSSSTSYHGSPIIRPSDRTPLLPKTEEADNNNNAGNGGRRKRRMICGIWESGNVGIVTALLMLAFFFGTIVVKNKTRTVDDQHYMATGHSGVVTSDVDECSALGVDVMRAGGNAVDAVIATGVCVGSVNMFASGIGGGGFMVVRMASSDDREAESRTFNFREMAPGKAHRDMYENNEGAAKRGGLAVGVPGEVHGLMTAHKQYGVFPWHGLWTPSAEINRRGFQVSPFFRGVMRPSEEYFETYRPDWEFLFSNDTDALVMSGETIRRPDFAEVLDKIAGDGSGDGYSGVRDFYNGSLAEEIVGAVQAAGGIITMADMANYFTEVTGTSKTTFRGHEVVTCPPPCSGHAMLEGLNIVENLPMSDPSKLLSHHYLVEAMKHLSAGRTELGDPTDPKVKANFPRIDELITKEYAEKLRANISSTHTYGWQHYNPRYEPNDPAGTSHISVIDAHGNAAALTTTVNLYWGALLKSPSGIILNSEMDDFSIPGKKNIFNLQPSVFNYIAPGKRPLSSSAPTIISHPSGGGGGGGVRLVLGASGGSRIVTAVFEAVVKNLIWGMGLIETVKSPRMHHQLMPHTLTVENAIEDWKIKGLRELGHELRIKNSGEAGMSVLHALGRSQRGGKVRGVADWWRKGGVARAY